MVPDITLKGALKSSESDMQESWIVLPLVFSVHSSSSIVSSSINARNSDSSKYVELQWFKNLIDVFLVVGFKKGTKALKIFLNGDKSYEAIIQLGSKNYADVSDLQVLEEKPYDHVTEEMIRKACRESFVGNIMQKPPV